MADGLTLLQFQSPWQGRAGFARHHLDEETGVLSPARRAKTKKLLRKGQKGIDGVVLFPTWPTRKGLIVTPTEDGLCLRAVAKGKIDPAAQPIYTSDPAYSNVISERGLYRKFSFSNGHKTIHFSDLSARLVSSHRTAYEVFPTPDFSPFARLIGIINDPDAHAKLVSDLNAGRFDYPSWSKAARRTHRSQQVPVTGN
ncbi:MAG: hypothetical protein ACSHX3_09530 [Litorimonas sp.]